MMIAQSKPNTKTVWFRQVLLTSLLAFGLGAPGVQAQEVPTGTLTLTKVPLFLNQAVDPNLLVSFDDSGSMTNGFMPDTVDDNCGWRHPRYYWSGYNKVYYNPNTVYVPPLQPDATPFPNANFTAAWLDGYEAATAIVSGAGGSSTVNLSNRYFPTRRKNARSGTNANTIVGHDYRAVNTTDCNNDGGANNNNAALPFGPTGTNSSDRGTGVNSAAFYYRFTGSDPTDATQVADPTNYVAVNVALAGATQRQNFANWFAYYRTRFLFARTAASRSFAVLDNNIRVAWQNFNNNQLSSTDEIRPLQGTWRQNFFDWLYRTNASGGTPLRASMIRAGNFFERSGSNFRNPYWEPATATSPARELTCRQNFHIALTDGFWNEGNPSHPSVNGSDDDDSTSWTLPDGTAYTPGSTDTRIYSAEPTTIGNAPTMADIAFYYWRRDLRPDLDDAVPPYFPDLSTGVTGPSMAPGFDPLTVPEVYFNPANNPASWQHMVNFIVGLGVAGGLTYPSDYDQLRTGPLTWPNTLNNHFTGVDDTWHAAINSRGEYFSAQDPQELVTALTRLFSSVQARSTSITPVSVSSALLTLGARAFRTGFDTSDWSGSVIGLDFVPDDPATPSINEESFVERWRAEDLLTARDPDSRRIWTSANRDGSSMVDFQWSQLNSEQQDFLRFNVATATLDSAAVGEARLEYIRGARDEEFVNGGTFRNRKSLLGAVVNSGATVISQPIGLYVDLPIDGDEANAVRGDEDAFSFEDGSAERNARYDEFRRSFRFRPERVYVGANDGMLHAFDGNSGEEIWGFVPYKVYPNLSRLSSPQDLDFQSYVDGTPEVRDAFIGGSWRTILVQTLRLGGQAVFAMDVTDANNPSLLWEYSDASSGGENLGFTYGQPYITRLHNGRWAALVPGGYNPEIADGNAGTREASLYVIDLQTGSLVRKFLLGNGTIGLGGVVGGDYALECDPGNLEFCTVTGANVRDVTDVAFAGDLTGNLWRFDLTDSSPGSWTVDRMFQARNGDGFAQPITAQPWLAFTEDRQVVVLFGTGKYLEPKDRTLSIPVQSMYGIFDQGPAAAGYPVVGQNRLLRQNLSVLGSGRTLTVSTIDHSQHRGWYFDFLDQGERNIVRTGVRVGAGVGITPTLIPTSDDPCNPAARSFLLFFDVTNGGIPGSARPTDSNGDGIPDYIVSFDTNGDRMINGSDDAQVIGESVNDFIAAVTPVTMPGGGEGRIILPGGSAGATSLVVPEFEWRRRSWRELFRE